MNNDETKDPAPGGMGREGLRDLDYVRTKVFEELAREAESLAIDERIRSTWDHRTEEQRQEARVRRLALDEAATALRALAAAPQQPPAVVAQATLQTRTAEPESRGPLAEAGQPALREAGETSGRSGGGSGAAFSPPSPEPATSGVDTLARPSASPATVSPAPAVPPVETPHRFVDHSGVGKPTRICHSCPHDREHAVHQQSSPATPPPVQADAPGERLATDKLVNLRDIRCESKLGRVCTAVYDCVAAGRCLAAPAAVQPDMGERCAKCGGDGYNKAPRLGDEPCPKCYGTGETQPTPGDAGARPAEHPPRWLAHEATPSCRGGQMFGDEVVDHSYECDQKTAAAEADTPRRRPPEDLADDLVRAIATLVGGEETEPKAMEWRKLPVVVKRLEAMRRAVLALLTADRRGGK